jgi:potassium channel LctB
MEHIWKLKKLQTVAPHEHEHRPTKLEFILAIIIALTLSASLLSQQYLPIPHSLIPLLILVFIGFKVRHILKKGGTLIEDYAAVAVIVFFLILYLILRGNIGPILVSVFVFILFYSAGLMLWVRSTFGSRRMGHFIISYIITALMIIFLCAGAYLSRSDEFTEFGKDTKITFEDALYFSTATLTTVGYGDISALGINRLVASIEAFIGMTINIALIGYVLSSGRFRNGEE